MKHNRKLDKNYYKEWCPDLNMIETFVFRVEKTNHIKRIDLHGLSIQEAYNKTFDFIEESHTNSIFEIKIVTGASGRIKKEFRCWLTKNILVKKYELINSGEFKIWLIK